MKQLNIIKELEPLSLQPAKTNLFSKKILPHKISRIKKYLPLGIFIHSEIVESCFNYQKVEIILFSEIVFLQQRALRFTEVFFVVILFHHRGFLFLD